MNKLLSKGKVIVSCISVLSILAVSLLSVFTGVSFVSSAANGKPAATYPINGDYDADVVIKKEGVTYVDIDTASKTVVSDFTEFDTKFWLTADGDGTANNPFIIKTANQFAAVATNNLVYDATVATTLDISFYKFTQVGADKILDTSGLSFKVADNVKAFNMNNTDAVADFSGTMTAEQVKAAFETATVKSGLDWTSKTAFKGKFDGNGVTIYGLKAVGTSTIALFPAAVGITVRNTTVKNSYFDGDFAAALIGQNKTGGVIIRNCAIYNNYAVSRRLNASSMYGNEGGGVALASNADGGSFSMYESIVYGNISKHFGSVAGNTYDGGTLPGHDKVYDLQYGLYPTSGNSDGAVIENCIVLDCAPYSLIYGYNVFHKSTYSNVYTNMIDKNIVNIGYGNYSKEQLVPTEYKETITFDDNKDGTFTHKYDIAKDGVDQGVKYVREYDETNFAKVSAADIIGTAAKTKMPNLDWSRWTLNASGAPTPKLYHVREYSAGSAWTGDVAVFFTSGDGSAATPYVVNTAEEFALMLMTARSGEHFELGTDIVINDTTAADWTKTAKQWFTSNDVPAFEGTLNGNGYYVSGLYYSGSQVGGSAGLIPVLGSKAVVKNLKVKDSLLNGKADMNLGAVSGYVDDYCAQVINISLITVESTVKFGGAATVGGIVGNIGYSSVRFSDCISKTAGIFNAVTGQASVKRCVSVGAYPFVNEQDVIADAVYTDTAALEVEGVTVVANADMLGDAAATAMPGLQIPTLWNAVAGDYPVPIGSTSSNGIKGDVWSGDVATGYAAGDGTEGNPYIIETAEQLALCVSKGETDVNKRHFKLGADIYLNDVNGKLWKDKLGCVEWFNQHTSNVSNTQYMTFDGDGYVIFGLYINNQNGKEYYRAGLFATLQQASTVKNLGISEAYLLGNTELQNEAIGAIAGTLTSWQMDNPTAIQIVKDVVGEQAYEEVCKPNTGMPTHSSAQTREITHNPEFAKFMPKIENCFVDHTCYVTGKSAGGLIGASGGAFLLKNCVVTASVSASSDEGAFVGNDYGMCSIFEDCLALTQTCIVPAMGGSHASWRNMIDYLCSEIIDTYYFSSMRMANTNFTKVTKPDDRVGSAAKEFMTGLDWEGDAEDGNEEIWRVIPNGTPMLTVFAKHGRSASQFESFSNKEFSPPTVTVTFETNDSSIKVASITGAMYDKMKLPTISRPGYKFTGWHVFDDCSLEYPYDYFPPRSLTLFAGWEPLGIIQDFENYPDTVWDYDEDSWVYNKPGAKGGYKNAYVQEGARSMHLLDTNTTSSDCLLNYEDMLEPGTAYTMTFWVATDKADNPATLLSLVHNSKPDYLNSAVALENMAVVTGLTVGEWVQYSYSFTAKTEWISIRATSRSSLYFDNFVITPLEGSLSNNNVVINLGSNVNSAVGGTLSPTTGTSVSVAVLISAIMSCAIIAVLSKKNLTETIDD